MTEAEFLALPQLPDALAFDMEERVIEGGFKVRVPVQRKVQPLWREEGDPIGFVDDSGQKWEVGRIDGVLGRRRPILPPTPESWVERSSPLLGKAATDVIAERHRQIIAEGWTPEHDDEHSSGGMAFAAAAYAVSSAGHAWNSSFIKSLWAWTGWATKWFKPKDARSDLIRAGALILAEIERLDRKKHP